MTLVQRPFELADGTAATTANTGASQVVAAGGGSVVHAVAAKAHGATGLRIINGASQAAVVRFALSATSETLATSVVFSITANPEVDTTLFGIRHAGGNVLRFQWRLSGTFAVLDVGNTINPLSGVTPTAGTRYRLTMQANWSAGTFTAKLYNDATGAQVGSTLTVTGANMGTAPFAFVDLGQSTGGTSKTTYYDDLQYNDGGTTELAPMKDVARTPLPRVAAFGDSKLNQGGTGSVQFPRPFTENHGWIGSEIYVSGVNSREFYGGTVTPTTQTSYNEMVASGFNPDYIVSVLGGNIRDKTPAEWKSQLDAYVALMDAAGTRQLFFTNLAYQDPTVGVAFNTWLNDYIRSNSRWHLIDQYKFIRDRETAGGTISWNVDGIHYEGGVNGYGMLNTFIASQVNLWRTNPSQYPATPAAAADPVAGFLAGWVQTSTAQVTVIPATSGPVRVGWSTSSDLSNLTWSSETTAVSGAAKVLLLSLPRNTRIYYTADVGGVRTARSGQFRTPQVSVDSFSFASSSCAVTASTSPVFGHIAAKTPDFFLHMGDMHYGNIATNDAALFRNAWDAVIASSTQRVLWEKTALVYTWDDHDSGPDNNDASSVTRPAASSAYRSRFPSYPLPSNAAGSAGIYHTFVRGRVRFIMLDVRTYRAPGTVLGTEQKAWFKDLCSTATEPLVIVNTVIPWLGTTGDTWSTYSNERLELATHMASTIKGRVLLYGGDQHGISADSGANNTVGGLNAPVFQTAALDQAGTDKGGVYTRPVVQGGQKFGLTTITDDGSTVTVKQEAYSANAVLWTDTYTFGTPQPQPANISRLLFDNGTNGATVVASDVGASQVIAVGGGVTYSSAAAAHGPLGIQIANSAGNSALVRRPVATTRSLSFSGVFSVNAEITTIMAFRAGSSALRIQTRPNGGLATLDVGNIYKDIAPSGLSLGTKYRLTLRAEVGSTAADGKVTAKLYDLNDAQIGNTLVVAGANIGTADLVAFDLGVITTALAKVTWDDVQWAENSTAEIAALTTDVTPPTVQAIVPVSVESAVVASLSAVADGAVTGWAWSQVSGPAVGLVQSGNVVKFDTPARMEASTIVLRVVASNGVIDSNPVNVTVNVFPHLYWAIDGDGLHALKSNVIGEPFEASVGGTPIFAAP